MPHVIIEHSGDVPRATLQTLCGALYDALAAHPAIPRPETLKLRTLEAGAHRLGTRGQSFAHATLLLLPGREHGVKSSLAEIILGVMDTHLADVHSLSVNLSDLDPAYAKRVLD